MSERLPTAEAAARAGVTAATWRSYGARGERPEPDGWIDGRTPFWLETTVDQWRQSRRRPGPQPMTADADSGDV